MHIGPFEPVLTRCGRGFPLRGQARRYHRHLFAQHRRTSVAMDVVDFEHLASRVFAAAPQRGGSREEGGVLGGGDDD